MTDIPSRQHLSGRPAEAGRLTVEAARRQAGALDDTSVRAVLDNLPHIIFILNSFRQIIFCNRHFLHFMRVPSDDAIIGRRPGEVLGCHRAPGASDGCGTGSDCHQCSALRTIRAALAGQEAEAECRLTCHGGSPFEALNVRVHARPVRLGGEDFILYSMQDVSGENRRLALERIFFHDILNTATGLRGLIQFLAEEVPPALRDDTRLLAGYFEQMVDDIQAQKHLLDAENQTLEVRLGELDPGEFLDDLAPLYRTHPLAAERTVRVAESCFGRSLRTDPLLLRRILDNMVKNALEAEPSGATVTLACRSGEDGVRFEVRNPTPIPETVRFHLFERSFSTKGAGRGLGTYGMRLFGERYLRGKVGFSSSPQEGTAFFLHLPWDPCMDDPK